MKITQVVIAFDGPIGGGKTTLSRAVAKHLRALGMRVDCMADTPEPGSADTLRVTFDIEAFHKAAAGR